MFSKSLFTIPQFEGNTQSTICVILIFFLTALEWLGREGDFAIDHITKSQSRLNRWLLYAFLIFIIGMYIPTNENAFIYFQF